MARIDLFNAKSSENVLAELPSKNGMDFNLAPGAGPEALPATLGTSQGNSNPNYSSNKDKHTAGQVFNPHGTLEPLVTQTLNTPTFSAESISGVNLTASGTFTGIAIATDTFSGTFSQAISIPNTSGTVSNIVILNIYSGTTTATSAFSGSAVQTSGAGWSQNGSNIVWTNGNYPAFSGASSAVAGRAIPVSGQSYFFDATYTVSLQSNTVGKVNNSLFGSLSVGQGVQDQWVGNNVFGKSVYGAPEVQITNYSGTRDSLSLPSNSNNIKKTTLIPNVGSRFYRA